MKFEYKQVAVLYKDLDECLQLAASEDWELIHIASSGVIGAKDNIYMLIFKKTMLPNYKTTQL